MVWAISQFDTGKYQTIKVFETVSIKVKSISATQPDWSNVLTIQEKTLHSSDETVTQNFAELLLFMFWLQFSAKVD